MNANRSDKIEIMSRYSQDSGVAVEFNGPPNSSLPAWIAGAALNSLSRRESSILPSPDAVAGESPSNKRLPPSINVAEFVMGRFIPDCVANRRSAARSYFRTILNHILAPELVARIFSASQETTNSKLRMIPGWPYLDDFELRDINAEIIQRLAVTALKHGYSTQMARHIRNVMSSILSHAIRTGFHAGPNPASLITLPAMIHKETRTLSLPQLASILEVMDYPERDITMFAIMTELRVAEICGLKWKFLNLSPLNRFVEGELIPAKTIAVRNQTYRGEFTNVEGSRKRFVRIPDLLCAELRSSRTRERFIGPDDFVLVSRNGTPVHPENIAARRLKAIGRSLGMPWLSWSVFLRTRATLKSQFGRRFNEEIEAVLFPASGGPRGNGESTRKNQP